MADLFTEVNEAIKQERLDNFLKNYGPYIIIFAIALILGTAINAGYRAWKNDTNKKQTAILFPALEENSIESLEGSLKTLHGDTAILAKLNLAGAYLDENKTEDAQKLYHELSQNADTPKEYQELARFMALRLTQDLSPEEKITALEPIWSDEQNSWRFHARLEAALILAHDLNNYKDARNHLNIIIHADDAPRSLRQKATSLDIVYAVKQGPEEETSGIKPSTDNTQETQTPKDTEE